MPIYYPRPLFNLSPTFTRWSLLSARTLHTELHQHAGFGGQNIWHHTNNHPIKWVRVVGVLVAHDTFDARYDLVLDDASGYTVDCVAWRNRPATPAPPGIEELVLGSVVRIGGVVTVFRGVRQLEVRVFRVLRDTNEEVRAIKARRAFEREVLARPWVLSEEVLSEEQERRKQVVVPVPVAEGGGGFCGRRRSPGRGFEVVIPPPHGHRDIPLVPEVPVPVPVPVLVPPAPKFLGRRRTSQQPEATVPAPAPAEAPPKFIGRKRPTGPAPVPPKPKPLAHKRTQSLDSPLSSLSSSSPPTDRGHKRSASSTGVTATTMAADPGPSLSFRSHKRIKLLPAEGGDGGGGERNRPLKPLSSPPQSFAVVVVPRSYDEYRKVPPTQPARPPTAPVFLGKRRSITDPPKVPSSPVSSLLPPARKRQRTPPPPTFEVQVEQQSKARFLGRRRVKELSTALLPPGSQPCSSARDLNRALAGERRKAETEPRVTRAAVARRRNRSLQDDPQVPSSSTTSTSASSSSAARTKRRTRSSQGEPPPPPPPPPPPQEEGSSFRGRRRAVAKPGPKPTTATPGPGPGPSGRRRRKAAHDEQPEEEEERVLMAALAMASPYVPTPTPASASTRKGTGAGAGPGELSFDFSDYVPSPVPPPPPVFMGRRRRK